MNKTLLLIALLLFPIFNFAQRGSRTFYCAEDLLLNEAMLNDPNLRYRINSVQSEISARIPNINPLSLPVVTIPVVVHIVSDPGDPSTNISDQQVIDQITALNNEFNVVNTTDIHFCLAQILPDQTTNWTALNGTGTPGITRTSNANISDHHADFEQGLLNSVAVGFDPEKYMNIWVVKNITSNNMANVLGYAPRPIIPSSVLDGVVIRYDVFGDNTFCSCYNLLPGYDQGKVLVHEAGHYLGLYHPFQRGVFNFDPTCQNNDCTLDGDLVCDTPPVWNGASTPAGPNFACVVIDNCLTDDDDLSTNNPFRPVVNGGIGNQNDQVENYMDYTLDNCKFLFTSGQDVRMHATIQAIRAVLVSDENLACTGVGPQCGPVVAALVPDFYIPGTQVCTGGTMMFTPASANNTATSYAWTFTGGSPSSSTSSSPVTVTYNSPGIYTVTLTVSDGTTNAINSQTIYVADCTVNDPTQSTWYFGDHASLLFAANVQPNAPWPPPSAEYSREGCVSVADNSGNPIFYSNGQEVHEAVTHTQMTGGTMNGSPNTPSGFSEASASQGAVTFPDPANSNQYYVFTVSDVGTTLNPLSYSIIDISLNQVITLNQPATPGGPLTTEHLAAIPDCDDQGYWVLTHGTASPNANKILAYHVTSSGVNSTPVTSNSFMVSNIYTHGVGQIDVSRDGSRIAITNSSGFCELYDFDRQTGMCSAAMQLPLNGGSYGVSFSPSGELLYTLGSGMGFTDLIQWDLSDWHCSSTPQGTHIASYGSFANNNSLQLGPDNRIYITSTYINNADNKLSIINFPDQPGTACGFNKDALSMIQQTPRQGLPNMVDAQHLPTPEIRHCVTSCQFLFYSTGCGTTYSWDFGDGIGTSTNVMPTYIYTVAGTYTVTLSIDGNPVTPVVVNATGVPTIFALDYTAPKSFVRLDPTTGNVVQTIAALTDLVNSHSGSSTFDPNHNLYIFSGVDLIGSTFVPQHYVIDVTTGNVTRTPINQANVEYEYFPSTNKLYGMNFSTTPVTFVEFDPLTGAVLQVLATLSSGLSPMQASSTLDEVNGRYIFKAIQTSTSQQFHCSINLSTNVLSSFAISNTTSEYEFDNQTSTLYTYASAVGSNPPTVDILNSNGTINSTVVSFPGLINTNMGCTTFDFNNGRYIFFGSLGSSGVRHYSVDCATNTFTSTSHSVAKGEYEYASCAPVCPTCRYGRFDNEEAQQPSPQTQEFLSTHPNPADRQTTFTYHVAQEGNVSLEIFDLSGKLIMNPVKGAVQAAGDYQVQWDTSDLAPGIYYCRLTTATGQSNSKMIITR